MLTVTLKISLMETSLIYIVPYLPILHPKKPIPPFEVIKSIPISEVHQNRIASFEIY